MTDPKIPKRAELAELIDRAFDYRGYVTLSRQGGEKLVGFVYDRSAAHVDLLDETAERRIRVAVDQIAGVEFTGEDSAARAQAIWERHRGAFAPGAFAPGPFAPGPFAPGPFAPIEAAAPADLADRPVLILVALPIELRSVAAALGARLRGATVRGRIAGSGTAAVGLAVGIAGGAARAVAAERPRLVISCGFAGALEPSLSTGDLVLASSVCDETGEVIFAAAPVLGAARRALAASAPVRLAEGELLCTTRIAGTAADKRALARPGRLAVDLESWPAAHAAVQAGIPWLAVRAVIDPRDAELPAFSREPRPGYVGPALRHALHGRRAVAELVDLARRAQTASRSLERALSGLDRIVAGLDGAGPGS